MRCHFCLAYTPDAAHAVAADWYPGFYTLRGTWGGPCCRRCGDRRLRVGEDGEYEERPADGSVRGVAEVY